MALPGGYTVGEKVFYTGESQTVSTARNGHGKVVHGQQGEVTGPGTGDNADKRVAVRFPSNTGSIECPLNKVSRGAPPPLPGGYTMGEKVFFTGSNRTWDDGDKLVHGQQGKVTGPVTGEKTKDTQVKVRFPGNRSNVVVNLTSVSRDDPKKAAAKAAALGLLQPLEALSLDADTLRTATAAAVAYCDAQGAASIADLVEHNLLDGLMASLTLKTVQANELSQALKGPADTAPPAKKSEAAKAAKAEEEKKAAAAEAAAEAQRAMNGLHLVEECPSTAASEAHLIETFVNSTSSDDDKFTNLSHTIDSWNQDLKKKESLVFHYTSWDIAQMIAKGGFKPSTTGMAGPGTYFTTSAPTKRLNGAKWPSTKWKEALLQDCFGGNWRNRQNACDSVIVSKVLERVLDPVENREAAWVVMDEYRTHIQVLYAVRLY